METERSAADLILAWRKLIYRATLAAAIVSVVVSLIIPNWYEATSTCMPPQEGESRGGLLSMFSQVGMDFGAAGLLSATPVTDSMIGVLKSRRIRGQVVDLFDLMTVYSSKTREHAINDLGDHLVAGTTPEGFIEVRVEDRDRDRAAGLANAFMEFLDDYHRLTSVERATRTRIYVETALEENGQRLDGATEALKDFQKQHMAIDLTEQTRVTVVAAAALETERTRLELERGVLEGFSRPDGMRMRQIDAELRELESKLGQVTGATKRSAEMAGGDASVVIPLSDIPDLAYRLADLTREVIVLEKVRAYLGSQLEDARIQETRDLEVVQVLDHAVPPVKKSRPRRSLIVILTTGLAFLASIGVCFLVDSLLEYSARAHASLGLGNSGPSRLVLRFSRRLKEWGGPDEGEGGPASAGS
ncbi:MAG: GNVR domain-containing protein [Candidatus Eisenbacteria bacterium]